MSLPPLNHTFFHISSIWPDREGADFPHPVHHRPIAVSILRVKNDEVKISSKVIEDIDTEEKALVSAFFRKMPDGAGNLVSFMGRRYGLPVMVYGALRHGVDASEYMQEERAFTARYSRQHTDLDDYLSGYGAVHTSASLSDYSQLMGLGKRPWVDVPRDFDDGLYQLIQDRLEVDVLIIAAVYLRVLLSQGQIDPEYYRSIAKTIFMTYYERSQMAHDFLEASDLKSYAAAANVPEKKKTTKKKSPAKKNVTKKRSSK